MRWTVSEPPTKEGQLTCAREAYARPVRVLATLAVVALAAGTAGPSSASAQAPPQRTAQQTSQPREATSPFTGLPADPAPVMAVKIDNHKDARPHTALEDADIVFVEKVEGGLSRLLGALLEQVPRGAGPGAQRPRVQRRAVADVRPSRTRLLGCTGRRRGPDREVRRSTASPTTTSRTRTSAAATTRRRTTSTRTPTRSSPRLPTPARARTSASASPTTHRRAASPPTSAPSTTARRRRPSTGRRTRTVG